MLAVGGADRRRPVALPRLLVRTTCPASRSLRGAAEAGLAGARGGSCAGGRRGGRRCSPTCWCAGARADALGAGGVGAAAGAMAWPRRARARTATALALALGALLAARRRPVAPAAWPGRVPVPPRDRRRGGARRRGCSAAARAAAPRLVRGRAWRSRLLPFLVVAPGDMLSTDVRLRLDEQHLQRLPFPLAPHGGRPEQDARVLVPARSWWPAPRCGRRGAARRRGGLRCVPLVARRRSPTCSARADEFHLVPLAAVLAVALAAAAARERAGASRVVARRRCWR